MVRTRTFSLLAAAALGVGTAFAPAPALAQAQEAPAPGTSEGVLPSDAADFRCFTLLQSRRASFVANETGDPARRAEVVNNLTIISAFYGGRLSHYPINEAATNIAAANRALTNSTAEQRDAYAEQCAQFYLRVANVLGEAGEESRQLEQGQQQGQQ